MSDHEETIKQALELARDICESHAKAAWSPHWPFEMAEGILALEQERHKDNTSRNWIRGFYETRLESVRAYGDEEHDRAERFLAVSQRFEEKLLRAEDNLKQERKNLARAIDERIKAERDLEEARESIKTIVTEDGVVVSRQRDQIKDLEDRILILTARLCYTV